MPERPVLSAVQHERSQMRKKQSQLQFVQPCNPKFTAHDAVQQIAGSQLERV
jgi:hypothetical protein